MVEYNWSIRDVDGGVNFWDIKKSRLAKEISRIASLANEKERIIIFLNLENNIGNVLRKTEDSTKRISPSEYSEFNLPTKEAEEIYHAWKLNRYHKTMI